MTRIFLFFLCFLFLQNSFSQQFYIRGRVIDNETKLPLKGASVYINNTTLGTITDEDGNFELGTFQPGIYQVVASYVGYKPLLYSAEVNTSGFLIRFKLDKKETIIREVLVLNSETRKRYIEIFKKFVLGISNAAEHCSVKNIEEVQFASGDTKDEIRAYTEKELVIENPELGYTLYFELVDFNYSKADSRAFFFGYTRYVDWGKDEETKKKWLRKRREAYEGSTVHFFRSLIKKELAGEGFTVYQLGRLQRSENDTISADASVQKTTTGIQMESKTIEDNMIRIYPDSVYRIYELLIAEGWRINYAKNTSLKTEVMKKTFLVQPRKGTLVGLRLRTAPVLINEKGIMLTPIGAYYEGVWAYERLANMLPEDYEVK